MTEPHPCPMSVGELMALHAIAKVAGFDQHAARLLAPGDGPSLDGSTGTCQRTTSAS